MEHPVQKVFEEMIDTVIKKAQDYAASDNVFSNFEFVAETVGLPVGTVFNVLIATKVARLMQLEGAGDTPNYESIEDTLIDLANYSALSVSWRREQEKKAKPAPYRWVVTPSRQQGRSEGMTEWIAYLRENMGES